MIYVGDGAARSPLWSGLLHTFDQVSAIDKQSMHVPSPDGCRHAWRPDVESCPIVESVINCDYRRVCRQSWILNVPRIGEAYDD